MVDKHFLYDWSNVRIKTSHDTRSSKVLCSSSNIFLKTQLGVSWAGSSDSSIRACKQSWMLACVCLSHECWRVYAWSVYAWSCGKHLYSQNGVWTDAGIWSGGLILYSWGCCSFAAPHLLLLLWVYRAPAQTWFPCKVNKKTCVAPGAIVHFRNWRHLQALSLYQHPTLWEFSTLHALLKNIT